MPIRAAAVAQFAIVVATFFESCVSREILGGDRAGPWLEVLAQVAGAGAAEVGGRAGGVTGVAGAAAGGIFPRAARKERGTWEGGGPAAEPVATSSPQKPLPLPCLGFHL